MMSMMILSKFDVVCETYTAFISSCRNGNVIAMICLPALAYAMAIAARLLAFIFLSALKTEAERYGGKFDKQIWQLLRLKMQSH